MIRALAVALFAAVIPSAGSTSPLLCDAYGDYVVCEDGRAYVAPDAVGRYVALPRHSPPQAQRPASAPADPRVFRRTLEAFEDQADAICRDRHPFDRDRRALCERQEIAAQVNATGDQVLIDWWAAGGAR